MTPQAALIELLERVGSSQGKAVLVNEEELTQWPIAAHENSRVACQNKTVFQCDMSRL